MATNSSRADILRLRLKALYDALYKLPSTVPVAELAGLMQHQANLSSQIADLEKQLAAEGAAAPIAASTASKLEGDSHSTAAMDIKIFYAWQDDRPKEICRDLIRRAAQEACNIIKMDRPEYNLVLDEGPLGAPGMCDIPNTILKKIRSCDIFLCDLTLVGSYLNRSSTTKKVSNPNVYFEFGFAVARIRFRRVIGVMNVAYGSPRDQVFDIKRRWALRYNLAEGADAAAQESARLKLTEKIADALLAVLEKSPSRKRILTGVSRFQQARESFESAVIRGEFHGLVADRAVLAVCLVPERFHRLDRNAIRHTLPPLLHENRACEWDTDRHTEISLAEGQSWKTVLDVNSAGVIRAAITLAIKGDVPDRLARRVLGAERAEHCIRCTQLQDTLVWSLHKWAAVMSKWQVASPVRLGVSLLAVRGWDLLLFDRELCERPYKEPSLSADPITIPSFDDLADPQKAFERLKPALDDIARAFGRGEWPLGSFGASG